MMRPPRPREDVVEVIDCDCGETLQAANEEDLRKVVATHMEEAHSPLSEDEVDALVAERSYQATDS
jgi:predicted small metal-binding protein